MEWKLLKEKFRIDIFNFVKNGLMKLTKNLLHKKKK
jgi:hypothetical protein